MSKLLRVLGYVWASPITVLGLAYVVFCSVMGWYRHVGVRKDALVWLVLTDKAPVWLNKRWAGWAGHTVGNVVVLKFDPDTTDEGRVTLVHEQEHVHQMMVLGVFQPYVYALSMLAIKLACKNADPYLDNSMEIDARRTAGQVIDRWGDRPVK